MFAQQVNRVAPKMPVGAYQTYAVGLPLQQWRRASCAEYECRAHLQGWETRVDERTELGMTQAYYIRRQSGRGYSEERDEAGLTVFRFAAGQTCFGSDRHMVPTRPPLYVVRAGDWRGNPTGQKRLHRRPEDWVDDFANRLDKLATAKQRG